MAELIGIASPEQIAEWKANNKRVHLIEVDGHVGYVKSPGRLEMSRASSVGINDPIKFNEILLTDCWLGGSDLIKTDDDLFMSASGVLAEIIHVTQATIKNL